MGSAKAALESLVPLPRRGPREARHHGERDEPGLTEDSVFNSLPDAVQDITRRWHESGWTPMGRMGTPADVGKAVALLCSEGAGWITGQVVNVDGGASLMDTAFPLEVQRG